MTPDRLVIRADATSAMGMGHVLRCLVVARAWQNRGGEVVFLGNIEAETLQRRLGDCGCEWVSPSGADAADLLRVSLPGQWVMLDGYHLPAALTQTLRQEGRLVLAVSDSLAQPAIHEDAHVLLNTGAGAERLEYTVRDDCVRLMGARYALLRPEFTAAGQGRQPEPESARRILLTFGGADSAGMSERAARILSACPVDGLHCRVVVGQTNSRGEAIRTAFEEQGVSAKMYQGCDDMAGLMAWADLGFAAGGVTALEMAATGLPAVVVSVADNQRLNVQGLVRAGAALSPGGVAAGDADMAAMLATVIGDRAHRQAMSDAGRAYLDGKGGERVARLMRTLSGAEDTFVLREAKSDDMMQYFHLANDRTVRQLSFSPEPIPLEAHAQWYEAKLKSGETAMFVLDCQGVVTAQARYEAEGDTAVVDFSVHPAFRGRGLGTRILAESCQSALKRLQIRRLRGEVLQNNPASAACFLKAGFVECREQILRGHACRVFEYGERT